MIICLGRYHLHRIYVIFILYFFTGLKSSGKTSLLKKLQDPESEVDPKSIVPTVGTNICYISANSAANATNRSKKKIESIMIQEIGGEMQPIWQIYYSQCSAVIFVINDHQLMDISTNCISLLNLLNHESISTKRLLIVINQSCTNSTLEPEAFQRALMLDDICKCFPSNEITNVECNIQTGKGIHLIREWILRS